MSKVSPSLLSLDFYNAKEDLLRVDHAKSFHYDFMDGQFVSNISFGHTILADIRPHLNGEVTVHLMTLTPFKHLEKYLKSGADQIIIHIEAVTKEELSLFLQQPRSYRFGLSLKPNTPITTLFPYLDKIDSVLIMSVEPGAGGQAFIDSSYQKIQQLYDFKVKNNLSFTIMVDGGVNRYNYQKLLDIGVDELVIGSALFKEKEPNLLIDEIENT
jgi:ribulose-phosphate 3-epimerase